MVMHWTSLYIWHTRQLLKSKPYTSINSKRLSFVTFRTNIFTSALEHGQRSKESHSFTCQSKSRTFHVRLCVTITQKRTIGGLTTCHVDGWNGHQVTRGLDHPMSCIYVIGWNKIKNKIKSSPLSRRDHAHIARVTPRSRLLWWVAKLHNA